MQGESKEIEKARRVLEEMSQDKNERYLAELRQKYIMDQKAIEDTGYDKGFGTVIFYKCKLNSKSLYFCSKMLDIT